MPPVVTGYLLLLSFGRRGPIGSFLAEEFGIVFSFRWTGAALACAVMGFPLMVRAIRLSIEAVDQRLEAAAGTLGANRLWVFATITLPLCLPGILAGAILAFAKSMGEFGATITFVSNIPGETQTLPSPDLRADPGAGRRRRRDAPHPGLDRDLHAGAARLRAAGQTHRRTAADGMSLDVDIDHRRGSFHLQARFTAAPGLTALFGRSGSGKTSLVSIVGGLIRPDRGRVSVDGQTLVDTESGVFVPSRTSGASATSSRTAASFRISACGGTCSTDAGSRAAAAAATADLGAVVELLGIGPLLERNPESLSGGEKQRVAIGRALLARPRLVLMDEPLASLDESRRAEILPYIERLRDEAGVPILYVSHSVAEVARLATTVVIMTEGKVMAVGPVQDILPLADANDGGAVLDATVSRHDETFHLSVLQSVAGELQVPRLNAAVGAPVRAYIRARDVMLSLKPPEDISALNVLAGRIASITATGGAQADIRLDCNGAVLMARLTAKSVDRLTLAPGRPVYAVVKSVSFERS